VIPLSELRDDPEGVLSRCLSSKEAVIVEVGDRGFVSIQPLGTGDDDLVDDLIENDPSFRELLARSLASPVEPFETTDDPGATRDQAKSR
jgi:hypothetical protein